MRLGGEATTPLDVEHFKKYFTPGCILYVGLAGTDFPLSVIYFIDQDTNPSDARVPLGYPMEDAEVLLLDNEGQEVGDDQTGEIAVKSRYLSPGYWRQPDLTQDSFRPDPQGGHARIYFTGDLGLRHSDGRLFHLGRKGLQVKIRGYRVEVGEIELVLQRMDNVKEAAVVAREDRLGGQKLVAYLVAREKPGPTITELRHTLAQNLPPYMVPAAFVTLDALPLLAGGKVNRQALLAPDNTRPELDSLFLAPRTPEEQDLAGIRAQVLGLDQVGIDDNFLELGGDSLLAMQVISRVIKTFKVNLPLSELFAAPTVAQMAVVVIQHQSKQAKPEDVERLLAELEVLSEQQAKELLDSKEAGNRRT